MVAEITTVGVAHVNHHFHDPRTEVEVMGLVQCLDCDTVLLDDNPPTPDRTPCPICGSTLRGIREDVEHILGLYQDLGMKQKRPRVKNPILEQKSGASRSRNTGAFNDRIRVIDRLNDRYFERVTDAATGEILHERDEALSHHFGRGMARLQVHGLAHEHIAIAAYFIWEMKNRPDGRDKQHWNMAVEDLKRAEAGIPTLYS